jgi:hypothetical protein
MTLTKTLIVVPFLLFVNFIGYTQTIDPIATDRPDQTECPFIVPAKHLQLESGLTFENVDKNQKNSLYPTILWRLGMNELFELRLITELAASKFFGQTISGIKPITVGFKTKLAKEKGLIPHTAFIGGLTLNSIGSKKFSTSYIAPNFRFTMQHTLNKKMSLSYNLGMTMDGETPTPIFLYTLTSAIALTDKLGFYAELYGFTPQKEKPDHRWDAGFTYLLKKNVLLDISGGFGLSEQSPKSYISFGYSVRFPK